jgi:putative lipoic acid-binding regulatory protein
MSDPNHAKFRELLDQNHQWPDFYTWKFIVKAESSSQVVALLAGHEITLKTSEKGTYVSISARKLVQTTDEVLAVYHLISGVPGVMSL